MIFSSMTFLWLFLPVTFIVHLVLPSSIKNIWLLIASLLFYSWGEPIYIFLMIFSIIINYFAALIIDKTQKLLGRRILLVGILVINIGLLWYFKYYDSFVGIINTFTNRQVLSVKDIALPIGISFYTFQILSYVIDVYWKKCDVQKNIISFALYVSFFPQLIAGPIVKYKDIASQLVCRKLHSKQIAVGIKRFIYGLSKKVILSNMIAEVVESIYATSVDVVDTKWLWIGAFLYTLQIYYDFSGYSDMAIGLGKMFGFEFPENFNYPYVSDSIQEFWRRWHISLSSWFREYVYIPLGGNRKGRFRTYINLGIVFVITGIWHGATLNYLLWGCWHGFFSLLERAFLQKELNRNKLPFLNHIYTMLVVVIGWVIFRCDSLKEAFKLLYYMFRLNRNHFYAWYDFFSVRSLVVIAIAVLLIGFIQTRSTKIHRIIFDTERLYIPEMIWQAVLLVICMILLIGGEYNPFIYFKF